MWLYVGLFITIIISIILFNELKKVKKEKELTKESLKILERDLQKRFEDYKSDLVKTRGIELAAEITSLNNEKRVLQKELDELSTYGKTDVYKEIAKLKAEEKEKLNRELIKFEEENQLIKQNILLEISDITLELEDYKARRDSINQIILQEKEKLEKQDFYRINVDLKAQEDIEVLNEMKIKLHHKEAISKLIWELYVRRPTQEMIKRITEGNKISGIYKITYLKTGEAYIGKTTDITTRWTNHIKTVCGLEGAAHSTLHTHMEGNGLWNYTFEIIEKVEKDKLSEREAFYIDFYDTKTYGLNQRKGG